MFRSSKVQKLIDRGICLRFDFRTTVMVIVTVVVDELFAVTGE